jgi:phenylacetate-CoA ligase
MGVYVSGVATALPSVAVAEKTGNMTVATVGTNKPEMLRLLRQLSPAYEQNILVGHPFFIKDIIETALAEKIKMPKVKMMFVSEGFNEQWRNYIANKAKCAAEHALSAYGSSELLLMGTETKESISARRELEKRKEFNVGLFQYNPLFRFIECVNGNFVFTAASGIPLSRFDMHDAGTIFSFEEMKKKVPEISTKNSWKIPFASLIGRSDHTFILYAANIYPEHIHAALNHPSFLKSITGKFTMEKGFDENKNATFEIHIELQKNEKPNDPLEKKISERIFETLKVINLEYADMLKHTDREKAYPRAHLEQYQNETYFKPGMKPKYILK